MNHDDITTLHIRGSWPAGEVFINNLEFLQRAVYGKDCIQVAYQENFWSSALAVCDQVPCPAEWRTVYPLGRKTQVFELRSEQITNRFYAGEIHRAAVDVH
jgi:hypothetical protein